METVTERLARTGAEFRALVRGTGADQWSGPTPCAGWDVAALVRHVVQGNRIFTAALAASPAAPEELAEEHAAHGPHELPDDVDASMAGLVAAFGRPGALDGPVAIPLGTVPGRVAAHLRLVENLVHGWDLATATGRRLPHDEADAAAALAFSEQARAMIPEGRTPFADPRPVPGDAPALDRLVALLGRDAGQSE